MSRRASPQGESLDLLLDTICNMFGLFIFVAMLVALLARVGGPRLVDGGDDDRRQASSMDSGTAAVARRISDLERRIATFEAGNLEQGRLAAEDGRARVQQARIELASRAELIRDLERELAGADDLTGMLDRIVPRLEADVGRLDEELRSAESILEVALRTPRLRELAERIPVQIVVSSGRVYCVNNWSDPDAHPCEGWTTWNEQAVDPDRSVAIVHYCWRTGGQDIERSIALRPNGGIEASSLADLERDGRWRQVMSWLHPDRHVVSIKVAPDSFAAFAPVRASIAQRGFFYDVAPVTVDPTYRDRIVEGATRAQ
jgi:hypothetical protein